MELARKTPENTQAETAAAVVLPQPSLREVQGLITHFEDAPAPRLLFPPHLEAKFHQETRESRLRQLTQNGIFALVLFDLFLLVDWLLFPEHMATALWLRLGVVTPVSLVLLLVARLRPSHLWSESLAGFLCLLAAACVLVLHSGISALVSLMAGTALALVLLAANTLLRLAPSIAVTVTALTLTLYCLFLGMDVFTPMRARLAGAGILLCVGVVSLAANYTLTRDRRLSYLLELRARLSNDMLERANESLQSQSTTDRLTGVPNRRAYDLKVAEVWAHARRLGEPLAAVVVDVDHFKTMNDTHGHAYGDHVLQRIASLLQQSLRGEDDFIARFGGEEFVILLPKTPLDAAVRVAERMRQMIFLAGAPSGKAGRTASRGNRWTTISCGVACIDPRHSERPEELIERADQAMYQAKQNGRNRVCHAGSLEAASQQTDAGFVPVS